jgi:hypothetical protein
MAPQSREVKKSSWNTWNTRKAKISKFSIYFYFEGKPLETRKPYDNKIGCKFDHVE